MHRLLIDSVEIPLLNSDAPLYIEANDSLNYQPGKAIKSGTLEIPETPESVGAFGNFADRRSKRNESFEAMYELNGIKLKGRLYIRGVADGIMKGQFITGNGVAAAEFKDKRLRDLTWTDWNHALTSANVLDSETRTGNYIYDIADRGETLYTDGLDITERFPAMRIYGILQKIFTGWTLSGSIFSDAAFLNKYLLFTGSNKVNNSDEWENTAYFRATEPGTKTTDYVYSVSGPILIKHKFYLDTEDEDPGGNYTIPPLGMPYFTVPETGSYRFQGTFFGAINRTMNGGGTPTIASYQATFQIYNITTSTAIYSSLVNIPAGASYPFDFDFDTGFIELTASDVYDIRVEISGDLSSGNSYPVTITVSEGGDIEWRVSVSRWFGYSSIVDFAKIVPDWSVTEFIAWFCKIFGQQLYVNPETKDAIFYPVTHKPTADDWTEKVQSISYTIPELTDYYLRLQRDNSDILGRQGPESDLEDSDTVADAEREATIELGYSPTYFRQSFRLGLVNKYIPFLWKEGTPAKSGVDSDFVLSAFSTTFNTRIVTFEGQETSSYKFYYLGTAHTTTTYPQFSMADLTPGEMMDDRHAAIIAMLRNDRVEVEAFLDITDVLPLVYTTTSDGLFVPILVNSTDSFLMKIERIETNGIRAKISGIIM